MIQKRRIVYANPAAENLLERPSKVLQNRLEQSFFLNNSDELFEGFIRRSHINLLKRQDLILERTGRDPLHVHTIVTALDIAETASF